VTPLLTPPAQAVLPTLDSPVLVLFGLALAGAAVSVLRKA
jgi:hypothetical protein